MSKQKLKGLWIPTEILLNNDLSDKEKIVLSMVLYLSDDTGSCFASNKYIASIVNVTSDRVSKIVSSLKEKGYVDVNLKYKMRTEIERLNGRIDRDYMFNDHFIRGQKKMELMLNLTFIVMLTIAKGHIKNKQENIRSLVA